MPEKTLETIFVKKSMLGSTVVTLAAPPMVAASAIIIGKTAFIWLCIDDNCAKAFAIILEDRPTKIVIIAHVIIILIMPVMPLDFSGINALETEKRSAKTTTIISGAKIATKPFFIAFTIPLKISPGVNVISPVIIFETSSL